jgi:hypothetical protein
MEVSNRYRVQNIIRCYKNQLLSKPLPLKHIKAIEAIVSCRTEERGVSAYQCLPAPQLFGVWGERSCSLVGAAKETIIELPAFSLCVHPATGVSRAVAVQSEVVYRDVL